MFNLMTSNRDSDGWQSQLDAFVRRYETELAALAWGLAQTRDADAQGTLGIDLQPPAHFMFCPKAALEDLNRKVDNQIQEILGFVDGHNPAEEVMFLGIGGAPTYALKLVQFKPQTPPPQCFEQLDQSVEQLLTMLEQQLQAEFAPSDAG